MSMTMSLTARDEAPETAAVNRSIAGHGRRAALDRKLDAALEDTFPCSDPVSLTVDWR